MQKVALLIIDAQYDFCESGVKQIPDGNGGMKEIHTTRGSLYVEGADKDMERLAEFINSNQSKIDYIGLTMDSHQVLDISHPGFWVDKDGNFPSPFTIISHADVLSGKWMARFYPNEATKYIEDLEKQGEFPHCIWPEHCIIGSKGASFVDCIQNAVQSWSRERKLFYQVVTKGTYPLTEHFGAFRANIPTVGHPETQLNQALIHKLESYDVVYFAGEAQSHCVANTLKQALEVPELAKKFVILTDCMSPVPGFEHIADKIYDDAKAIGVQFVKSTDVKL